MSLGYHHTEEVKRKISEKLKGRKKPREVVEKVANANRGKKRNTPPWNIGLKTPDHVKKKISVATKKAMSLPGVREKIIRANCMRSSEVKNRISATVRALWKSKEYRKMMSDSHIGQKAWKKNVPLTPEYKKNLIAAINKPETLALKSEKSKMLWKDYEYVKKVQIGVKIHPNKPETVLFNILNILYLNGWKYTGDLSFIINGKNPAFVNCNGKKKCIEMFGDYWHRGENPEDRKEIFKEFGYDTLVIWEHELKDIESVKNRITDFCAVKEGK